MYRKYKLYSDFRVLRRRPYSESESNRHEERLVFHADDDKLASQQGR